VSDSRSDARFLPNGGSSLTLAVAVQSNGEILTVFLALNNTSTMLETLPIRLNTNGSIDTTFGNSRLGAAQLSSANKLERQRYRRAGATSRERRPDTSFGAGGLVEIVTPIDLPSTPAQLSGDGILAFNTAGNAAQFNSDGALITTAGGTIVATKDAGTLNGLAILPTDDSSRPEPSPGQTARRMSMPWWNASN
jgi:hypothetical protein